MISTEKESGTPTNPATGAEPLWTDMEVVNALIYAKEVLDRCQIPFCFVGEAAYQAYTNQPFRVHKIIFTVNPGHEENPYIDLIEPKREITTDGFRIYYHTVPIWVKFMTKWYPVLKTPDRIWVYTESFPIPNPFMVYWNMAVKPEV